MILNEIMPRMLSRRTKVVHIIGSCNTILFYKQLVHYVHSSLTCNKILPETENAHE